VSNPLDFVLRIEDGSQYTIHQGAGLSQARVGMAIRSRFRGGSTPRRARARSAASAAVSAA